ncbi:MAG: glycosyltransferase family 39 protein [Anaerolineae bacterium]|nr:glycosyltransferase family 39 protein [Anaerolineae bacterium]
MRLYPFEPKSLWLDESVEYLVAARPVGEVPLAARDLTHDPPFLGLLLSLWMEEGRSDLYLRMVPISFSMLTIAAVYALSRRAFTFWVGILAALLMAIAPRSVYYGQEIGQYALAPFFAIVGLIALEAFLRESSLKSWGNFFLIGIVAFFVYYPLVIYIAAMMVVGTLYVLAKRSWRDLRLWIGGGILIGVVGLLLWFLYTLPQKERLPDGFAVARYTMGAINPVTEVVSWGKQTAEIVGFLYWGHSPSDLKWLTVGLLLIGVSVALVQSQSRRLSLYLISGLGVSYLASGFGFFVYSYHRYLWHFFPLCTILISAAALFPLRARQKPLRLAGILLSGLLVGLFIVRLPVVSGIPEEEVEQLAQVVSYVESHWEADDRVYVYYGAAPAFSVYANETMLQAAVVESWIRSASAEEKWSRVWQIAAGRPRVWVLFSHVWEDDERSLLEGLTAHCRRLDGIQKIKANGYLFDCSD